jgi:putative ABC transport system permease protein
MLSDLRYRLRALFRRAHVERELDDELRFHLDRQRESYLASGMTVEEASRQVRVHFGVMDTVKDDCRDAWGLRAIDELARNLRYAGRTLAKRPGFAVVCIATLGLAIGANSAVFSALNAIVLRPLPFPDAHQLVRIDQYEPGAARASTFAAPARVEDWNRLATAFRGVTGYFLDDLTETSGEFPERISRAWVAPRFFDVLGVPPARGRVFTADEERFGGPQAAIVSERFWTRRFGASDDQPGRTLRIGTQFVPIVGVMPASFTFPNASVDVWSPSPPNAPYARNRQATWLVTVGRLRTATSREMGEADLNRVQAALGRQYPATDAKLALSVVALKALTVGGATRSLWMLFAAVSLLLAVACTNIAALLLARNAERRREIAIRYSLGASRARVLGQLLTEATILACLGSAVGIGLAMAGLRILRTSASGLPRVDEIGLDVTLVAYSLACGVGAALFFGLLPALRSIKSTTRQATWQRRTETTATTRLQWTLVTIQVALSVTLLFGAGLLTRSFDRLTRVPLGFDPSSVLTFRITGNWGETVDLAALTRRVDATLDALRHVPGVAGAATSVAVPGVPFEFDSEVRIQELPAEANRRIVAAGRIVSSGYFATLQIPLVAGAECADDPPSTAALVNRSFARLYLAGGGTGLGYHLSEVLPDGRPVMSATIVGLVEDAKEQGLTEPSRPTIYWCNSAPVPTPVFLVHAQVDPASALAETIRRRIHEIDAGRAMYDVHPLAERLDDTLAESRFRTVLLTAFAVTAVSLSAIGLYGTLSYIVTMRRREIGVRLAMGALRRDTVLLFVRQGISVTVAGCIAGLWLSAAARRGLSGMLYGISFVDPVTVGGVVAVVLVMGIAASMWPAIRAARVDPVQVLRED